MISVAPAGDATVAQRGHIDRHLLAHVSQDAVDEAAPPDAGPRADLPAWCGSWRSATPATTASLAEPICTARAPGRRAGVLSSAQVRLRSESAPHLDPCVALIVPFADQTEPGLLGTVWGQRMQRQERKP
jgi:hypothetical protein